MTVGPADPSGEPEELAEDDLSPLDLVRVLVVEDDPRLRQLAKLLLEEAGCRVATVGDGREALASASAFPPDIIVLDISLPGVGGREVARTLQWDPVTAEARFVVVTGTANRRDVLSRWEVLPDAVLEKPYDPPDLIDAVLTAARAARRVQRPSG